MCAAVDLLIFFRIWTQFYRLAVCLREGTSSPECTLLPSLQIIQKDNEAASQRAFNTLLLNPAADHALAYVITEEGVSAHWI